MNLLALIFLSCNAVLLLFLPRRYAPLPLIVGACYMTYGQGIELGPFSFTVIRMLVAVGFVRAILRGERLAAGMIGLDWLMLTWSGWALISSIFYVDPLQSLIFRLGLVYNAIGIYFLIRIFCHTQEDLTALIRIMAVLLIPLALAMINERITRYNLFSLMGGVSETSQMREGVVRAQGPFRHPILAGTVGAVSLPLMIGLWAQYRRSSFIGIIACLTMVFASGSSGPLLSSMAGIMALFMWKIRGHMRLVRWLAVLGYIALDLIMKAPAYYLIARTGLGGTGWHRAKLIEQAIGHIDEWWLAGTDYTRHWMPTGVSWSPDHTDITNHYIQMGVWGGLPLMFLFIVIIFKSFSYIGQSLQRVDENNFSFKFFLWSIGSSLFANVATMISVSYFDQSFIFLYLTIAAICTVWSIALISQEEEDSKSLVHFRLDSEGESPSSVYK